MTKASTSMTPSRSMPSGPLFLKVRKLEVTNIDMVSYIIKTTTTKKYILDQTDKEIAHGPTAI